MSKDTILIVTGSDEVTAPNVIRFLEEMDQLYVRLDTDLFLENSVKFSLGSTGFSFDGKMKLRGNPLFSFSSIKSVWFRRPKPISARGFYDNEVEREFVEKEVSVALWSLYTNLEQSFWMNHPLATRHTLEHNKLFQLRLASLAGLITPDSIITNDAVELLAFCRKRGGSIAIKPLRSHIFQNDDGSASGIYTHRVSEAYIKDHFGNIASCPLIAQQYIPKKLELRITIVGRHTFACAIHSQDSDRTRDDWRRYDFDRVKHEPFQLPLDVQNCLLAFMKKCNINFGAVDMILTPDDGYVFLEVNPSGQFGWIESLTGMPISKAIAETLSNPSVN